WSRWTTTLTKSVGTKPFISTAPCPRIVLNLGAALLLRVEAKGFPIPSFQWLHQVRGRDWAPSPNATTDTLHIEECTLGATGLYCCRVSNIFGEVETEPTAVIVREEEDEDEVRKPTDRRLSRKSKIQYYRQITLKLHGDPPKIVALRPTSLKVVEGESFEVMVKVTGNPKPTYQWWKDGDLLPQYEEPVLAGYDGVCNLLERSAAVQHTGRYVCKASNAVEDVYSQEVIVKVFRSVELLRAEDFHTRALEVASRHSPFLMPPSQRELATPPIPDAMDCVSIAVSPTPSPRTPVLNLGAISTLTGNPIKSVNHLDL
ncbi:hypothetical protein CYMTET_36378, partial [Cymbomonas tetramitiformis]